MPTVTLTNTDYEEIINIAPGEVYVEIPVRQPNPSRPNNTKAMRVATGVIGSSSPPPFGLQITAAKMANIDSPDYTVELWVDLKVGTVGQHQVFIFSRGENNFGQSAFSGYALILTKSPAGNTSVTLFRMHDFSPATSVVIPVGLTDRVGLRLTVVDGDNNLPVIDVEYNVEDTGWVTAISAYEDALGGQYFGVKGKAGFLFNGTQFDGSEEAIIDELSVTEAIPAVPLPPIITTMSPANGSIVGGDVVVITGQNLGTVTDVLVDGVSVRFNILSATVLNLITPAHVAGTVSVLVENPDGDDSDTYQYQNVPAMVPPLEAFTDAAWVNGEVLFPFDEGFEDLAEMTRRTEASSYPVLVVGARPGSAGTKSGVMYRQGTWPFTGGITEITATYVEMMSGLPSGLYVGGLFRVQSNGQPQPFNSTIQSVDHNTLRIYSVDPIPLAYQTNNGMMEAHMGYRDAHSSQYTFGGVDEVVGIAHFYGPLLENVRQRLSFKVDRLPDVTDAATIPLSGGIEVMNRYRSEYERVADDAFHFEHWLSAQFIVRRPESVRVDFDADEVLISVSQCTHSPGRYTTLDLQVEIGGGQLQLASVPVNFSGFVIIEPHTGPAEKFRCSAFVSGNNGTVTLDGVLAAQHLAGARVWISTSSETFLTRHATLYTGVVTLPGAGANGGVSEWLRPQFAAKTIGNTIQYAVVLTDALGNETAVYSQTTGAGAPEIFIGKPSRNGYRRRFTGTLDTSWPAFAVFADDWRIEEEI